MASPQSGTYSAWVIRERGQLLFIPGPCCHVVHGLLLRATESFDEYDKALDQLIPEGNGMILEEADLISTYVSRKCVIANSSFLTMGCIAGRTLSECENTWLRSCSLKSFTGGKCPGRKRAGFHIRRCRQVPGSYLAQWGANLGWSCSLMPFPGILLCSGCVTYYPALAEVNELPGSMAWGENNLYF